MTFIELAKERRSCRAFLDQAVSHDSVHSLLEAAIAAPSAGNRQAWHFVVITGAGERAEVANAAQQPFIGTAPVILAVCAHAARNADKYGERGEQLFAVQDTAAAMQNLLLAATEAGLGTCWIGGFDEAAVATAIGVPNGMRLVALTPIGFPAPDAFEKPRTNRDPVDAVTTWR
jgi:nitroreductase